MPQLKDLVGWASMMFQATKQHGLTDKQKKFVKSACEAFIQMQAKVGCIAKSMCEDRSDSGQELDTNVVDRRVVASLFSVANFDEEEIEVVMKQAEVDRATAEAALKQYGISWMQFWN